MALSREVKVAIVGDSKLLKGALKEAGTATDEAAGKWDKANKLIAGAAAGAAVAVIAFGKASVDAYKNAGTETLKLQRLMGGTAEAASDLRGAAELTGTDIDALGKGMVKLSKAIEGSNDTVKDFGFASRDAQGNLLPLHDTLLNVAERFASMPAGVEKNTEAVKLFGRAGTDLLPFLNRGKDGLEALEKKAKSLGIELSGNDLQAIKDNKQATREWGAALEGLQITIGRTVLPALTDLAKMAVSIAQGLGNIKPENNDAFAAGQARLATSSYQQLLETIQNERGVVKDFHHDVNQNLMDLDLFGAAASLQGQRAAADIIKQAEYYTQFGSAATIAFNDEHKGREVNIDSMVNYIRQQDALGVHFGTAADAANSYANSQGNVMHAVGLTTDQIDKQDEDLKTLTDDLKAQFSPLFGYIDAQQKLNDANWAAAVALKEHGSKSAEYKKAAEDAGKAALDFKIAQEQLVEAVQTGRVSLEEGTSTLQDWVAQGMITQDTASSLEQEFRKAGYASQIKGSATMDTSQAIQAIIDFYKWTHANKIDVPLQLKTGIKMQAAAAGGNLSDGWFMVGEEGPEAGRKSGSSVEIFSNRSPQTQAMMGHGGQGGDIVLQINGAELMRWINGQMRQGEMAKQRVS